MSMAKARRVAVAVAKDVAKAKVKENNRGQCPVFKLGSHVTVVGRSTTSGINVGNQP